MKSITIGLMTILVLMVGCSENNDSMANKAGEKVGSLLTEFAEGAGKGIDQKMLIDVRFDKDFKAKGITSSVAKQDSIAEKSIVLYLIGEKEFSGKIMIKAYNEADQEIGRSTEEVTLTEDEAKYTTFKFHEEMDVQLVIYYVASIN